MSINVNTMQTIAERVKDALLVVGRKIDDCNAVEHALNGGSFSSGVLFGDLVEKLHQK